MSADAAAAESTFEREVSPGGAAAAGDLMAVAAVGVWGGWRVRSARRFNTSVGDFVCNGWGFRKYIQLEKGFNLKAQAVVDVVLHVGDVSARCFREKKSAAVAEDDGAKTHWRAGQGLLRYASGGCCCIQSSASARQCRHTKLPGAITGLIFQRNM